MKSNPTLNNILKFLLFLGVGLLLVYLSVRGIKPEDRAVTLKAFKDANYTWVVLSLLVGILSHLIRAVRWNMLIESIDKKPKVANSFCSIMVGYMANYAVPRLGEISRCGVLSKYENVSFTEVFGTVIVERVIDLLMLFLFFIFMIVIESKKAFEMIAQVDLGGKLKVWMQSHVLIMILLVVILCAGIIFIFRSKNKLLTLVKKYIQSFWLGIKSVGKVKKPILFWVYSLSIWLAYLVSLYLCFFCFPETSQLSLGDGLVLLIVGSVAVIITPGGTGAYQLLLTNVLMAVYHIPDRFSVALPWILWGSQFILLVSLRLLSLLLLPIINKNDKTGVPQYENI